MKHFTFRVLSVTAVCACLAVVSGGCAATPAQKNITAAKQFRALLKQKEVEQAHAILVEDSRMWFEERAGEGSPWRPGLREGRWANWDTHFRSENTPISWSGDDRSASVLMSEINDYYRLLERGAQQVRMTYFFDERGRIEGLLIAGEGERSPGRSDEFYAWARKHHAEELAELLPEGSIDPTGDHAPRYRALLNEWRGTVGLPPIE